MTHLVPDYDSYNGFEGDHHGNYGLLDQQLALEFIRENCENIGGDDQRIIISGHGGGGMSVGYHLLSPRSD